MNLKDTKLLWGRAASRCAICKTKLSEVKKSENEYLIGEQAHIVGEKATAARGHSNLTKEERNSYHNIILLCPNHHTEIDKNPSKYTVEKLHLIKSDFGFDILTFRKNEILNEFAKKK
jgi:predicted restriction endonuclease